MTDCREPPMVCHMRRYHMAAMLDRGEMRCHLWKCLVCKKWKEEGSMPSKHGICVKCQKESKSIVAFGMCHTCYSKLTPEERTELRRKVMQENGKKNSAKKTQERIDRAPSETQKALAAIEGLPPPTTFGHTPPAPPPIQGLVIPIDNVEGLRAAIELEAGVELRTVENQALWVLRQVFLFQGKKV